MKRIPTFLKVRDSLIILALIFSSIFIFCVPSSYAQQAVFRAGASTANVTPFLGDVIVGGFGVPIANHVHDELHARTLVLDDGKVKLVFVIVDNVSINREVFDEAKRLIQEETQIPKEHVLMSAVHTHSATSASGAGEKRRGWNVGKPLDDYQRFLVRRMADGVRIALNNMEPARIGWGVGNVPQHLFNRRWKMKTPVVNPFGGQDQVVMNPGVGNTNMKEPAGATDPGVSFISVQSLGGRPIAVLANYSLHYVGGLPGDHLSADYFAMFADRVQELLKADRQDPPFVGILSNGTSGDVNNVDYRAPGTKYPPYAKMRLVANDVADEVLKVYKTIQHQNWVPLTAAQSELNLKVRKPDSKMLDYAQKVLAKPDSETPVHRLEKIYAGRTMQMQEWPDNIDVILQTFRIGELGIAAIPFEVFTETGLQIKAKSPFETSFTIELANGNYGYLPTPAQHKLGGYETWLSTNKVETEASEKIVTELLKLFNKLK
ncbi:MAG: hypothetical protein B7X86_07380 [Sphingobacteriales bacterium 17-39-43]|jgi:hypothetical protein|uniref:hypothetical protein n=1 Tax=Daejeonella sp. TaxID=2805397 RepID=UPI000BC9242B|nr:hypothetical protein [Daejeonella sp.]OYY05811.1 MAG: hypothetical protein B7Y76_00600 [Sphingobacteriia bacterium 35-40-5]OYZ31810.1 MAG: hypothetical protein B7Y24_08245 [Sphingobacteriales bacterium 16-39-50]OYZ59484.1 MAG: hypothetical protein B7Y19_00940 [Sphingobacteriales bacterium 24-40-4]OZA24865.1 MAG: hypothetical protein B7X86_07380 [Sphingobacteriales bacterium 17-39-43]OZA62161.1 MAG: hypothetical protein B7X75_00485 [Sphingobacteriales bacterium 39-40-5]